MWIVVMLDVLDNLSNIKGLRSIVLVVSRDS